MGGTLRSHILLLKSWHSSKYHIIGYLSLQAASCYYWSQLEAIFSIEVILRGVLSISGQFSLWCLKNVPLKKRRMKPRALVKDRWIKKNLNFIFFLFFFFCFLHADTSGFSYGGIRPMKYCCLDWFSNLAIFCVALGKFNLPVPLILKLIGDNLLVLILYLIPYIIYLFYQACF